ncbi:MAG: hydroxyacid dehydrogenase [Clostridia bacterium]|nr:hydroxyacid dehydrogenase [Clostridia bacterium]
MKAIIMGGDVVRRVYTKETAGKLAALTGEAPVFAPFGGTDAEAIFTTWGMPYCPREQVRETYPNLKYIFYGAGSVQGFAAPFLAEGVRVFSAWQANGVPVAEFTVSQIVLCGKRYFDVFTGARTAPKGNYGLKVGMIGLGTIGKLVCRMLSRYRFEVLAYDKFLPDSTFAALGVKRASLEQIFAECDVISNHLANNAQTKGMLNAELLRSMKPDAYFINTGRGAQVDHGALYDVLRESPARTALLDVTVPEPLPPDHPLRTLKNCIVSPHIAGSLGAEVGRMGEYMAEEYGRITRGEPPLYEVTQAMLEVMA